MNLQTTLELYKAFFDACTKLFSAIKTYNNAVNNSNAIFANFINIRDEQTFKKQISKLSAWFCSALKNENVARSLIAFTKLIEKHLQKNSKNKRNNKSSIAFFYNCLASLHYLKSFNFSTTSSSGRAQPGSTISLYVQQVLFQTNQERSKETNQEIFKSGILKYKVPKILSCVSPSKNATQLAFKASATYLKGLAVVVVAGGIGERLQYSGVKLQLTNVQATNVSFMQTFIETIMALQNLANENKAGKIIHENGNIKTKVPSQKIPAQKVFASLGEFFIPLIIIVNSEIFQQIKSILVRNNYFGARRQQIKILVQRNFPCVINTKGHFAFCEDGKLLVKPSGHGDAHRLLQRSKTLQWLKSINKTHLLFLQDSNMQVLSSIPLLLCAMEKPFVISRAASKKLMPLNKTTLSSNTANANNNFKKPKFVFVAINKLDKQKMGLLAKAEISKPKKSNKETNKEINKGSNKKSVTKIGNVEYHLHEKLSHLFSGKLQSYPVNTNTLLVNLNAYAKVAKKYAHALPCYFNAKKKENKSANVFSTAARLEQLLQDISWFYKPEDVCILKLHTSVGFSAVKNSITAASKKTKMMFTCKNAEQRYFSKMISLLYFANKFYIFNNYKAENYKNYINILTSDRSGEKISESISKKISKSGFSKLHPAPHILNTTAFKEMLKNNNNNPSVIKTISALPQIYFSAHYFYHSNFFKEINNNRFDAFSMLLVKGEGKLALSGLHFQPFSALKITLCKGAYLFYKPPSKRLQLNRFVKLKGGAYRIKTPISELEKLFGYAIQFTNLQEVTINKPGKYALIIKEDGISYKSV